MGHPLKGTAKKTTTPKDPVCGKRIKRQRAHIAINYKGATYYLCCPLCQAEFEQHPDKYALRDRG
ncbi:MAG: YHS domain-containing protein [Chloroflexi bacterium]|nr:YHS domain-containing protein [Chloroflexota bacterium]